MRFINYPLIRAGNIGEDRRIFLQRNVEIGGVLLTREEIVMDSMYLTRVLRCRSLIITG